MAFRTNECEQAALNVFLLTTKEKHFFEFVRARQQSGRVKKLFRLRAIERNKTIYIGNYK